jgi:hypothetical protein
VGIVVVGKTVGAGYKVGASVVGTVVGATGDIVSRAEMVGDRVGEKVVNAIVGAAVMGNLVAGGNVTLIGANVAVLVGEMVATVGAALVGANDIIVSSVGVGLCAKELGLTVSGRVTMGLHVRMGDAVRFAEGRMKGFSEFVRICVGLSVSNGRGVGLAVGNVILAVGKTVGRNDEGSVELSGPMFDFVGVAVDGTILSLATVVGCVVVKVGVSMLGWRFVHSCEGARVMVVVTLVGYTVGSTAPFFIGYIVSNVVGGMPSTDGAVDRAQVIGGVLVDGLSALSFFPFSLLSCFLFRLSERSVSSTSEEPCAPRSWLVVALVTMLALKSAPAQSIKGIESSSSSLSMVRAKMFCEQLDSFLSLFPVSG